MMTRRLDQAMISERLREIQLLLGDLEDLGDIDAERLRRERPTRHIVERVLSQIVELAGSVNTHIVVSTLGRAPQSYAASFDDVARAGVLDWEFAAALRPSAGMRNVLVRDYLRIDHAMVADAVSFAHQQFGEYVRRVAGWLDLGSPADADGPSPT